MTVTFAEKCATMEQLNNVASANNGRVPRFTLQRGATETDGKAETKRRNMLSNGLHRLSVTSDAPIPSVNFLAAPSTRRQIFKWNGRVRF